MAGMTYWQTGLLGRNDRTKNPQEQQMAIGFSSGR
jgi:hypothetical protein